MTKIADLPSIINTETLYYGGCVLVTNGYDDNGDYVTGQITAVKIIDEYINHKIDWNSPQILSKDQFLYATYYNTSDYYLCGLSIDDLASNIASSISEQDYLSDYICSSISDYVSLGYLSDYLSEYMSDYLDSYIYSYISSSLGSYVDYMPQTYFSSGIDGIVVKNGSGLEYIATSSFNDAIYYAIYYDGPYPHSLSDSTPIAGMDAYSRLASITLGDIVSYVKSHL